LKKRSKKLLSVGFSGGGNYAAAPGRFGNGGSHVPLFTAGRKKDSNTKDTKEEKVTKRKKMKEKRRSHIISLLQ
jgi:hypothetical protein